VDLNVSGRMTVTARSAWRPAWLPGADSIEHGPLFAALKRKERRHASKVPGDPVWAELLGQDWYLGAGQRLAVRAATLMKPGRTMLVVLPTGGGKSMAAHAPAVLEAQENATTLLVVPTVALALDQEQRLREQFGGGRGRSTEDFAYHGGLAPDRKQAFRQRIADGNQPVIVASPEAVVQGLCSSLLRCAGRGGLRSIVVDEAHLVSQWGTEFRPDFQALAGVRRLLVAASPADRAPRTLLLTATVTQDSWRTLKTLFGTPELDLVVADHLRPEPSYWLAAAPDEATRKAWMFEALGVLPRPLILYTALREDADAWHALLHEGGLRRIGKLHGSTPTLERARQLDRWSRSQTDVMVATSAFGLGMDKADVRTIIHACVPETIDRYYQEVGRGGRDGAASLSLMIHTPKDLRTARYLNTERVVGIEKGRVRWRHMYSQHESFDDDRILVSLNALPPHIHCDSDANVAWNLRTLILMARAGLLELDAAAPPHLERGPDETDEVFEQRMQAAFERYRLTVAVRLLGHDHLDERVWADQVESSRRETLEADRRSLNYMMSLLAGETRIADLLQEAYTLQTDGFKTIPNRVDGHCPVARRDGGRPDDYLEPEPLFSVQLQTAVGARLRRLLLDRRPPTLIAAPAFGGDPMRWREALLPVLQILVTEGIREIRASAAWSRLDGYRRLYRSAQPRVVFHTVLDGAGLSIDDLAVPRLTIAEPGVDVMALLADAVSSGRPADLLLVPEDIPDPTRPDRPFIVVRNCIPLEQLQRELN
jgi:ATP-dependent DNA helicase RecQ